MESKKQLTERALKNKIKRKPTQRTERHNIKDNIKHSIGIKKVFDEYNDNANKPYDLEISVGFNKIIWNKEINFDNETKVADSNMYLDKQTKKPFKKKL